MFTNARAPLADCDESRGIVLEDHAAKGLKQMLSHIVSGPYEANIPEMQHGAVAGRGTDYAAHLVHCFQAYCAATSRSSFAWFVDLVKAFDRIVREVCKRMRPKHVRACFLYHRMYRRGVRARRPPIQPALSLLSRLANCRTVPSSP